MNRLIQIAVLLTLASLATGCASPYMIDRGRDAADIYTCTIGVGAGAKAQVGPLSSGLTVNRDFWGLRGGVVESTRDLETFELDLIGWRTVLADTHNKTAAWRGKDFCAMGLGPVTFPFPHNLTALEKGAGSKFFYFSQIEVAVGLGPSIRLGFNPGELLDFILGWFTIDIYNDDLEKRKSNKTIEGTGTNAPEPSL